MRPALRWVQRLLTACAVSLLVWCGFVLLDARLFQRQEDHLLAMPLSPASFALSPTGSLIGRMDIRRLGLSTVVMEGTGAKTLRRAAGHIPGTALPGEPGNVGISGHRDTFFRPLRNIEPNDIVTLTTLRGTYRYRVLSTEVVEPDDIAVLNPGERETLTLVTCYPFYFVGPAPKRFVVRAERF